MLLIDNLRLAKRRPAFVTFRHALTIFEAHALLGYLIKHGLVLLLVAVVLMMMIICTAGFAPWRIEQALGD